MTPRPPAWPAAKCPNPVAEVTGNRAFDPPAPLITRLIVPNFNDTRFPFQPAESCNCPQCLDHYGMRRDEAPR